jgi:hypothetical protein
MNKKEEKIFYDNLYERLKEHEFFRESHETEIKLMNWLLAIAIGILILTVSNINQFLIDDKLFLKPLFIFYTVLLSLSILFIGFLRFLHYISDLGLTTMRSSIKKRQWRLDNNIGDKEENITKILQSIEGWTKAYNLVSDQIGFLKNGFIMLFTSILVFIIYFILLILFKY